MGGRNREKKGWLTGPRLTKRTARPRPDYIGLIARIHRFGPTKKTVQQNQISGDDLEWKKLQQNFQVKVLGADSGMNHLKNSSLFWALRQMFCFGDSPRSNKNQSCDTPSVQIHGINPHKSRGQSQHAS